MDARDGMQDPTELSAEGGLDLVLARLELLVARNDDAQNEVGSLEIGDRDVLTRGDAVPLGLERRAVPEGRVMSLELLHQLRHERRRDAGDAVGVDLAVPLVRLQDDAERRRHFHLTCSVSSLLRLRYYYFNISDVIRQL